MASPAPQPNLRRYAERMGWTDVPWYTICTERFSADFEVDEWFGLNVFLRDGNDVYRTYFLQHGAMVKFIGSIWSMWSLTPYAGQSDDEDMPEGWPRAPQSYWYRRHDEFDGPAPSARRGVDGNDQPVAAADGGHSVRPPRSTPRRRRRPRPESARAGPGR